MSGRPKGECGGGGRGGDKEPVFWALLSVRRACLLGPWRHSGVERGLVEAGGEGGWKERGEDFRAGRGERREIGCIIIILVATFLHYQVYYTYYIIHTCISIDIEQSASLTFSVAVFRAGQSSDVLT